MIRKNCAAPVNRKWISLMTGIAAGYAFLIGLYLGLGK